MTNHRKITLIACPKGFQDPHIAVIQRNAYTSWKSRSSIGQIIIFGNDPGVPAAAEEFGFISHPSLETNELGTPLLRSIFSTADAIAASDIICYVNSDILLFEDFDVGVEHLLLQIGDKPFLATGRRWNVDIQSELEEKQLHKAVEKCSRGSFCAMDYFIFRKGFFSQMPPFLLGRIAWDNWAALNALDQKIPFIDLSDVVRVYHQNHSYAHRTSDGRVLKEEVRFAGEESKANQKLINDTALLCSLHDTTFRLYRGKLVKRFTGTWRRNCDRFRKFTQERDLLGVCLRPFSVAVNRVLIYFWKIVYGERFF